MTERPITPSQPLADILDRLLEQAMRKEAPSFHDLAKAAGLNPACDFVGASLRDIDFRDEDLRGFDFSKADLTGADFRRAKVEGVRFKEATLDGAIGLPDRSVQQHKPIVIFISYRRLDNQVPEATSKRFGFVDYLMRQVRARLEEDGEPTVILWDDHSQIEPGDIFSEAIAKALNRADLFVVVLSRNYITSSWCTKELEAMKERAGGPAASLEGRIFRVDKHKVPEDQIPTALRRIHAVQFYREDKDADSVDEFFWGGKVRLSREFDRATLDLASAIRSRVEELRSQA